MNDIEYIADPLSDYSIHSEDSIQVEDSDGDVGPRRRSRAIPLECSNDSCDSEMSTESHNYSELWSDTDNVPNIPNFTAHPGPKIFPADKKSVKDVVELFIGNDLFELMVNANGKSSVYYQQNKDNMNKGKTMPKWHNITLAEMKKFLGTIILMGQVKKDVRDKYWTTEFYTKTPAFATIMSRNKFRQIWTSWHFSNN